MRVFSNDFEHGEWMPCELAYGRLKEGRFALSDNLNPHSIFPNRPAKDGPGMRKTDARASPCFRSSSFRSGYSPAMKSRMARSCASMLCKSRN